MANIKKQVSQNVFNRLEDLMEESEELGPEGLAEYLKAAAYGLGAQVAVTGNVESMPTLINDLLTVFGRGVQAGMLTAHGMHGRFGVQVHGVIKS